MILQPKGIEEYPALATFMHEWFHEDWDIYGETLEEILPHYTRVTGQSEPTAVIRDIERFERTHGHSPGELVTAIEEIFDPGVFVEGWDGMTTREWLHHVIELIR